MKTTIHTLFFKDKDSATVTFAEPVAINCVVIKEFLRDGQSVAGFHLSFYDDKNSLLKEVNGTTIGRKRILTFPSVQAKSFTLTIDDENAPASLSEIEAYKIDDSLIEK